MAQQITPLSPSLPATTGIQDPAARQFAAAVSDILRTAQSPGYALSQLTRATAEMSGGNTPAAVQQWLVSTELYNKLTQAIQRVDTEATQAVAQERQERIAAIVAEGQARADEIAQEVLDRIAAVQAEETARALAVQAVVDDLEQEIIDRAAAVQAESAARMQALLNEAADRGTAISQEATERQSADDAIAQSVTNLSASVGGSISAIQDTLTALAGADSAEATARQTLAAQLRGTYEGGDLGAVPSGLLYQERVARVSGDETVAQSVTSLQTSVGNSLATLGDEIETVSTAVSSEASARQTLASQMRGTYEGGDLSAITSGLLYQERTARTAADQGLAQQITLLSAGAGEQFDYKKIWYFDSGDEGWTGNGTPTVSGGWLRPANATDPYLVSPTGIAADGAQYTQVRLRIRKTGTPTWAGELWWRTAVDSTWDSARKTTISEPTYDGNGIGLVTINLPWSGVIDRVRVDLSTVQDAGNGYDVDWVAVGRPSPGASSAALLEESLARTSAIDAEATSRRALSTKLTGLQDPASATLATLTSGLLYDERQARSSADSTEVTARQNLAVKLTGLADPASATLATLSSGLIYDERTARASQDGVLASSISTLSGRVDDAEADISTETSLRIAGDNTQATARQALSTKLTGLQDPSSATLATLTSGLIYDERQARSSADATEVTARQNLAVKLVGMTDPSGATLATLSSGLIYDERTARVAQDGVLASSISTLSGRVGDAEADIVEEASLRVTGDQANANAISGLSGRIGDAEAAITTETGLRVNADLALTQSISTQAGRIDNANTAITSEATTRTNNDLAIVGAVNTALAQITGVSTSISQSGQNLIANWSQAQANKWNQIEAEVLTSGGQTVRAALQQESNARATLAGQVSATWTVKAEVDSGTGKPYIAGLALGASGQGGATTSEFIVRADALKVVMPGYGEHVPFAIGPSGASFIGAQNTGGIAQPFQGWNLGPQSLVTVSDGKVGGVVLRLGVAGNTVSFWPTQTSFVPIDPTKKYRVRFWARPSSDCNGLLYFALRQAINETGAWGSTNVGLSPYKPATVTKAAHDAAFGAGQWGEYSNIWSATDWQEGVKFFRPTFLNNYNGTAGYWDVQGLVIEEATDVEAAKDAANAAQQAANAANTTLADIAADNKLTPAEKQAIRKEWDAIYAERAGIRAQADSFGITAEKTSYDNDFQALGTYLNGGTAYTIGATPPSWITDANLATTTTIVGTTFRANWSNLYADRQVLLNKISAEAAKRADWSSVSGKTGFAALDGKITSGNVTTYIDYAAIGNAQIGGDIWSSNHVAGSAGWRIYRSGNAEFRNVTARGDIEASSLKADTAMVQTLNIAGNAVIVPVSAEYASAAVYNAYVQGVEAQFELMSATVTVNVACSAILFIGCNDPLSTGNHTVSAGNGGRGTFNLANGSEWASIRLYRNGDLIDRIAYAYVNGAEKGRGLHKTTYQASENLCDAVYVDSLVRRIDLVAGTNVISVWGWAKMSDGDAGAWRNKNAYMVLMGTQR